ncbi:DUF1360 domain-containing protein [Pontibacillus marinus]|uniref:Sporulation protein yjcA n=1 Tax=Pontibacillus marinus BH030004 = DSM 16465 TaxID=1385511 RepID=A0A0A5G2X6_9BACI|nr:DUF1360 domain-containing protein [Pontibacillus marinus]KGX85430.1 Sporulation protein yjcA [Pontibacillus marinus BH030004 = DSM 16465]
MSVSWMELLILVFASFRITRLFVYDSITEWIRKPFHRYVEHETEDGETETYIEIKGRGLRAFIGELLSCHWCTGFWVSAVVLISYLYVPILYPLWIIFAISGVVALLFEIFQGE